MRSDTDLHFSLIAINQATTAFGEVLAVIAEAGPLFGIGPAAQHRVPVELQDPQTADQWRTELPLNSLPSGSSFSGHVVPSVRIDFTSPLRLLDKSKGKTRELIREPQCEDLIRASIDLLLSIARFSGEPCSADRAALLQAAAGVKLADSELIDFEQHTSVGRSAQRIRFEAVLGYLLFVDVPIELLPWLVWGGRLHVGDRRAAGAGAWTIQL